MNSLPIFQTDDKNFSLMQTKWASTLNPLVRNPSLQSIILTDVKLSIGNNTINHYLGRELQGWRIIRKRGPAEIYDNQDTNQMPKLTLVLHSDHVVSVDLEVL